MKWKLTEKQRMALLVTGITAAVYISLKYILPLVIPFLLAYWVALLVRPASRWLHKKFWLKEGLWASLLVTALSAALLVGIYYLGELFFEQLFLAARRLPVYIRYLSGWLGDLCCKCDECFGLSRGTSLEFLYDQCSKAVENAGTKAGAYVMENSMGILKGLVKSGAVFAIISIGSVLMVSSMDRIRKYRSTSVFRQEITTITGCLSRIGKAFFRTQLLIMGLTCLICGTGLYFLGNSYAVLLGVVIGLLDALPVFGTGTVFIPWIIVCVFSRRFVYAVGLSAIYILCYFLREILEAKLMGGHMGIAPLEMLISMYIGLALFGVAGFILGPFAFMVIRELVELYGERH
ncbi:MAG: AI-2E family transporter [Lachnospiraceae bacterium]|nr:AI-2E family transporter [Lachnospiraceae bacterium]